jgi:hypothetical protein
MSFRKGKFKWERSQLALVILIGSAAGFLAAFLTATYLPHEIYVMEGSQQAYDILKHLTTVIIALVSVLAAVGGILIGWLLHRILNKELSDRITSQVLEYGNNILADLHKSTASLWGHLYERSKENDLIAMAFDQAKKAVDYAEGLDKEKFLETRLKAFNNYLMILAEKRNENDIPEAHRYVGALERLLEEHEKDLGTAECQSYQETIYFLRWLLPLNPKDRAEAIKSFRSLKGHPDFDSWLQRWKNFGFKG